MMAGMLTDAQYRFLETSRVGRLATADAKGEPHLIPVCYAVIGENAYITVDEKPKRTDIALKRIRNIRENPAVALTVDRWDEDWSRLAWVMLRGRADILDAGEEHDAAQALSAIPVDGYRTAAGDRDPDRAGAVLGGFFEVAWVRASGDRGDGVIVVAVWCRDAVTAGPRFSQEPADRL
jgi:PPOX class probable F420-dependent enzyme